MFEHDFIAKPSGGFFGGDHGWVAIAFARLRRHCLNTIPKKGGRLGVSSTSRLLINVDGLVHVGAVSAVLFFWVNPSIEFRAENAGYRQMLNNAWSRKTK